MDEEMILNISRVAQISKEDVIEKVKEYRTPLRSIYDFYLAFGRFPTLGESETVATYGIHNITRSTHTSSLKQQFKVIHIELNEPYMGKKHHYFGSKAAIYEYLPEEIIGIKLESLWNMDLDKEEYKNKLCTIYMGILRRKQTARGGKQNK